MTGLHLFQPLQEQIGISHGSRYRNWEKDACLPVVSSQPSGLCVVVETAAPENSWKEERTDGESQEQEHEKENDDDSEVG